MIIYAEIANNYLTRLFLKAVVSNHISRIRLYTTISWFIYMLLLLDIPPAPT